MKRAVMTMLVIASMVWLAGCSLIQRSGTVYGELNKPEFQAKLQPEREIRFLIMSSDGERDEAMEKLIERTSPIYQEQFGMKFRIVGYRQYGKPGTAIVPRPNAMLQAMYEATKEDPKSFDVAIAGQGACVLDFMSLIVPIPTYVALIDDMYRRYIIMRVYDKYALAHEVAHAFVYSKTHTYCLLGSWYPFGTSCYWLPKEDWTEAMTNKFRDFSVKPGIPEENVSDVFIETLISDKKPGVYYHPNEVLDLNHQ